MQPAAAQGPASWGGGLGRARVQGGRAGLCARASLCQEMSWVWTVKIGAKGVQPGVGEETLGGGRRGAKAAQGLPRTQGVEGCPGWAPRGANGDCAQCGGSITQESAMLGARRPPPTRRARRMPHASGEAGRTAGFSRVCVCVGGGAYPGPGASAKRRGRHQAGRLERDGYILVIY